jgi:hypothetical protein
VRFSVQFGPADDVSVGADDVFVLVALREATRKRLPPQMFDTVRIAFAGHCFESMYDIGRPQEATPCGCPHFLHWGRHGGLPLPKIWRTESNRGGVMDHGPSAVFALVVIVSNRCTMLGEPNNRVRGERLSGSPSLRNCASGSPAHSSSVDGSPTRGSAVPNLRRCQGVPPTLGEKSLRCSLPLPSSGLPTCARSTPQLPRMPLRQESFRLA